MEVMGRTTGNRGSHQMDLARDKPPARNDTPLPADYFRRGRAHHRPTQGHCTRVARRSAVGNRRSSFHLCGKTEKSRGRRSSKFLGRPPCSPCDLAWPPRARIPCSRDRHDTGRLRLQSLSVGDTCFANGGHDSPARRRDLVCIRICSSSLRERARFRRPNRIVSRAELYSAVWQRPFRAHERSVDVYSWVALAPQTSEILSLLGVANTLHPVVGSTAPGLTFSPRNFVGPVTIVITTACSGIYSFGIFASAFVAFVLTEYEKPSPRVWAMLGFGLLTSYAANVFRMVVIVLVGYYTDTAQTDLQNMIVAHSYAGWAIFLTWIAAFWTILLKFFGPESIPATRVEYAITRNSCRICDRDLTPAILATRCECGASYHQTCLRSAGSCPRCGAAPPLVHQVN